MSRLRDLGRDTAYYFGVGEGSVRARESEAKQATWLGTAVGVVPVLVVAFVLRRILGLDDDFTGFRLLLGLILVLAVIWGLVLRQARRT
jgi:hypothetical protein